MRVVVVGTGRCGTVTFTKACRHLTNYTSKHESTSGMTSAAALRLPDNHIEVNPHLSRMLWPLDRELAGADVLWVHLQRKREEVVESWVRRGRKAGVGLWTPLVMRVNAQKLNDEQWRYACGLCYDSITGDIGAFMRTRTDGQQMHMWLHEAQARWPEFLKRIKARGNGRASQAEWNIRHNATR